VDKKLPAALGAPVTLHQRIRRTRATPPPPTTPPPPLRLPRAQQPMLAPRILLARSTSFTLSVLLRSVSMRRKTSFALITRPLWCVISAAFIALKDAPVRLHKGGREQQQQRLHVGGRCVQLVISDCI
jgi:hypothetical protein